MSKISIKFDIAFNIFFPFTATHSFAPVPPVPPTPPPLPAAPLTLAACAFEIPVTMLWPPGSLLGKNKLTTTVKHNNCTITQDGQDCGSMIVHVQMAPAPNNLLTAMHIPFSSRKSMFCASTVMMNGKMVACNTLVGIPPTPMMYCSEPINMPLSSADTSHLNSVSVKITLVDWLLGAAYIALSMVVDKICGKLFDNTPYQSTMPSNWRDVVGDVVKKAALGPLGALNRRGVAEFFIKNGLAVATGLARMGATDGPVSFNITVGDTYLENQIGLSRDASGEMEYSRNLRVGPASGKVSNEGIAGTLDGPTSSSEESIEWGEML